MKYIKFFFRKIIKILKGFFVTSAVFIIIFLFFLLILYTDGYTLEDIGIEINLNPFDYCNLTDVEYTAVLQDEPGENAKVDITEYITFDVHAASKSNPFKELWRELPEDTVDGLRTTYNVKSVTQILENGTEIEYMPANHMYWEDSDYTTYTTRHWYHSNGSGYYPDNDESLLIYIPWTYRDKLKFKIEYSMNYAALKYRDCSELYLTMYSGSTIRKLKSFKAQVLVPDNLMPSAYNIYTMGTSNKIQYTESSHINPGYNTFSIDLDQSDLKFKKNNEYIEFCLLAFGKDKHIFTQNAPSNDYTSEDALEDCIKEDTYYSTLNERSNIYKSILLISSIILSLLIIYLSIKKYNKIKENYTFFEPDNIYKNFSGLPSKIDPIFASQLVFMKDPFSETMEEGEEYSAVLLSLIRKGYVKITKIDENSEWTEKNTKLELKQLKTIYNTSENSVELPNQSTEQESKVVDYKTGIELEPLTTSERLYLELLEKHLRHIIPSLNLKNLQQSISEDYEYTQSFIKDIEKKPMLECGVIGGYFQQTDYDILQKKFLKSAKISLIISIILIFIINFISSFTLLHMGFGAYTILGIAFLWKYFYLTLKSNDVVLFTQFGVNEQAKWVSFYNYLNNEEEIKNADISDLSVWEDYLIYATAFGIAKNVVKTIKINALKMNIDNSPIINHHSYIHSHHRHRISRSLGRSLHTSSRGGGFGGHGYGGGRRRWRRWRWPLINKKETVIVLYKYFTVSFLLV